MAARLELTTRRGMTLFQSDHIWSNDRLLAARSRFMGRFHLRCYKERARHFGLQRAFRALSENRITGAASTDMAQFSI